MRSSQFIVVCCCLLATTAGAATRRAGYPDLGVGDGCTSFVLDNDGYAVFGTNFDHVKDRYQGLIFVNRRGLSKSFETADSLDSRSDWVSKYGSVTFNLIASQTPWGGMNETGLVITLMRLEGSTCPKPDSRECVASHFWQQYVLDNFATVDEVIASDSSIRIFGSGRIPHYLVSDRHGNCAIVEFVDGRTVIHSGRNLPVKALANSAYEESIAEWREVLNLRKERKRISPMGSSSKGRFIRAADRVASFRPANTDVAVRTAFDILDDAGGLMLGNPSPRPNWSIVFDTRNLRIHFRTIVNPEIRTIDFDKLDFSCASPARMLDINEKLSGDITDKLKEHSFDMHFRHAVDAGRKWGLQMSPEELRQHIGRVDAFPCE